MNLVEEVRSAQPAYISASLYLNTRQHSLSYLEGTRMLLHGLMLKCLHILVMYQLNIKKGDVLIKQAMFYTRARDAYQARDSKAIWSWLQAYPTPNLAS